jgi:tetratricopeptide (TPR) repeat protein
MAKKRQPRRTARGFEEELTQASVQRKKPKGDFEGLLRHIQDNPMMYVGGVVFLAVAVLAGILFRMSTDLTEQSLASDYARALDQQDALLRLAELDKIAGRKGDLAAEIAYMTGEAAYEAREYDRAAAAYERVRSDFADSAYLADALEGLGYVAEEQARYDAAIAFYEQAGQVPESFASRIQPYNIGRVRERLDQFPEALAAYENQTLTFPSSQASVRATAAIARLRTSHPELFPSEPVAADPVVQTEAVESDSVESEDPAATTSVE